MVDELLQSVQCLDGSQTNPDEPSAVEDQPVEYCQIAVGPPRKKLQNTMR